MREALDPVIPSLSETILELNTSEEERKLCLEDLHKLKHAVSYYQLVEQLAE